MIVPIINTERLKLEPLSLEHSEGMFELWSNKKVTKYSGTVSDYNGNVIEMPAKGKSESDLIIDFWLKAVCENWGFRWAITLLENREFIGTIGFNSLTENFEIAYHLIPKYWGKGLMTEASLVAINWAQSREADSVVAFVDPDNKASIALALRTGLLETSEFEDKARKYQKLLK